MGKYKITWDDFAKWLDYPLDKIEQAISIVQISDPDGAYTHAQDMGEFEISEIIHNIYFEYGSLKEALKACKEDLNDGINEISFFRKNKKNDNSELEKEIKNYNWVGACFEVADSKDIVKGVKGKLNRLKSDLPNLYKANPSLFDTDKTSTIKVKGKTLYIPQTFAFIKSDDGGIKSGDEIIKIILNTINNMNENKSDKKKTIVEKNETFKSKKKLFEMMGKLNKNFKLNESEETQDKWEGVDADLETSLSEYGFIATQKENRDYPDEWFVVYKTGDNKYDTGHIQESDLDTLVKGEDWMDEKDVESFLSHAGSSLEEFLNSGFINKLSSLLGYYGYMNIFGTSYGDSYTLEQMKNTLNF